jgi:hypothetical protein
LEKIDSTHTDIGCQRKHVRIQKHFNVSVSAPKSPYEHYLIFKEILLDKNTQATWHSQILYFSEQFIEEVKNNEKWLKLKLYFSESLRKKITQHTYDASCNDLLQNNLDHQDQLVNLKKGNP